MNKKHPGALSSDLCTQVVGSQTPFGGQDTAKSSLKVGFFLHAFSSMAILCDVRLPCIALGTLVVINGDEWVPRGVHL